MKQMREFVQKAIDAVTDTPFVAGEFWELLEATVDKEKKLEVTQKKKLEVTEKKKLLEALNNFWSGAHESLEIIDRWMDREKASGSAD